MGDIRQQRGDDFGKRETCFGVQPFSGAEKGRMGIEEIGGFGNDAPDAFRSDGNNHPVGVRDRLFHQGFGLHGVGKGNVRQVFEVDAPRLNVFHQFRVAVPQPHGMAFRAEQMRQGAAPASRAQNGYRLLIHAPNYSQLRRIWQPTPRHFTARPGGIPHKSRTSFLLWYTLCYISL